MMMMSLAARLHRPLFIYIFSLGVAGTENPHTQPLYVLYNMQLLIIGYLFVKSHVHISLWIAAECAAGSEGVNYYTKREIKNLYSSP
jgi:hypothetical protein